MNFVELVLQNWDNDEELCMEKNYFERIIFNNSNFQTFLDKSPNSLVNEIKWNDMGQNHIFVLHRITSN